MYVKYGDYQHPDHLTGFTLTRQREYGVRSQVPAYERRTVTMTGYLLGTSQSDLRTKIQNLEAAYSVDGLLWGLYHDDGSLSAHSLPLTNLLQPIRVLSPPSYPDSSPGEYATQRTYTITLEGYYFLQATNQVLDFSESFTFQGSGGPRFVILETLLGVPISHQVTNFTSCRATQTGSATGSLSYPTASQPLFPQWEISESRQIVRGAPEQLAFAIRNYPVSWSYSYWSPTPLL